MAFCRRILAALLALRLLTGGALAELLCVSAEDCAALLLDDGTELIAPGLYDEIFCLVNGERYAVGRAGESGMRYALCDASGVLLTDFLYAMLSASDGVILFRQDGLCGALDMSGTEMIPAVYTQLAAAGDGYFFALTGDPNDDAADEILIVSPANEALTTGVRTANGLSMLSSDRMLYRDPRTERYGYLDGQGRVAVEAAFEYAGAFEGGLARASEEGKLGVIDPEGTWRILPKYDFLEFGDGIIVCLEGGETCVVFDAATCEERYRVEGDSIRAATVGSCAIVVDDEEMILYSADGAPLLTLAPDVTVFPGAGDQLLLSDGDWGSECIRIIRPDGTLAQRRDQHLLPLDDARYAFMTMRVAAYYSDALGEIRYSCDYDSMRFGLMDTEGREILPAEYLEIRALGENRYLTIAEDGLRVVDGAGTILWSRVEEEPEA